MAGDDWPATPYRWAEQQPAEVDERRGRGSALLGVRLHRDAFRIKVPERLMLRTGDGVGKPTGGF